MLSSCLHTSKQNIGISFWLEEGMSEVNRRKCLHAGLTQEGEPWKCSGLSSKSPWCAWGLCCHQPCSPVLTYVGTFSSLLCFHHLFLFLFLLLWIIYMQRAAAHSKKLPVKHPGKQYIGSYRIPKQTKNKICRCSYLASFLTRGDGCAQTQWQVNVPSELFSALCVLAHCGWDAHGRISISLLLVGSVWHTGFLWPLKSIAYKTGECLLGPPGDVMHGWFVVLLWEGLSPSIGH